MVESTRAHTATLATVARGAATKRVEQEDEEEEKRQAELCGRGDLRLAQRLQVALGCRCTQRMELEKFPLETWASRVAILGAPCVSMPVCRCPDTLGL